MCPNCGRRVYHGPGVPDARIWCRCDTFAPVTGDDELTIAGLPEPLALF